MRNSNKWLMHVGDRVQDDTILLVSVFIVFLYIFIQYVNLWIVQNNGHILK
jgi:hypothetical protein